MAMQSYYLPCHKNNSYGEVQPALWTGTGDYLCPEEGEDGVEVTPDWTDDCPMEPVVYVGLCEARDALVRHGFQWTAPGGEAYGWVVRVVMDPDLGVDDDAARVVELFGHSLQDSMNPFSDRVTSVLLSAPLACTSDDGPVDECPSGYFTR